MLPTQPKKWEEGELISEATKHKTDENKATKHKTDEEMNKIQIQIEENTNANTRR